MVADISFSWGLARIGGDRRLRLVPANPDGAAPFTGSDGSRPEGGLIFDSSGNLYGTTVFGGGRPECGVTGCGVVFKLSPPGAYNNYEVLHSFGQAGAEGTQPEADLIGRNGYFFGTLYGTTSGGRLFEQGRGVQAGPLHWAHCLPSTPHPMTDAFEANSSFTLSNRRGYKLHHAGVPRRDGSRLDHLRWTRPSNAFIAFKSARFRRGNLFSSR